VSAMTFSSVREQQEPLVARSLRGGERVDREPTHGRAKKIRSVAHDDTGKGG
jgi:hypothetical protein